MTLKKIISKKNEPLEYRRTTDDLNGTNVREYF